MSILYIHKQKKDSRDDVEVTASEIILATRNQRSHYNDIDRDLIIVYTFCVDER